MPETKGHLLPIYVLVDESRSMAGNIGQLNEGLASLHSALLAEPMTAAKVRFSIIGFSDKVAVRLHLADLRLTNGLPGVQSLGATNYGVAFAGAQGQIAHDVPALKSQGYEVHRPAVFFLSDGQPTDGDGWRASHRRLTDRGTFPAAPNIIACGIGDARPDTILEVASQREFAFVSIPGSDVGRSIAKFCTALTKSVVKSGRALANGTAELVFERPEGFRMAIDVI